MKKIDLLSALTKTNEHNKLFMSVLNGEIKLIMATNFVDFRVATTLLDYNAVNNGDGGAR